MKIAIEQRLFRTGLSMNKEVYCRLRAGVTVAQKLTLFCIASTGCFALNSVSNELKPTRM
jgi:hypothetical protein